MTDWKEYAKYGDLRSVIDPADELGYKNNYLSGIHHKILSDGIRNNLQGKRVLDFGCGIGRFTEFLKDCGASEIIGLDFCDEMLQENVGCTRKIYAPVYDLPLEDQSVDAVLSVWTMQYLDIKLLVQSVKEIERVLSPGGIVYAIEQLSHKGYDSVFPRYLSDYQLAFENFDMMHSRSIIRERDLLVGIIRRGFVPDSYFPWLIPHHLNITKGLELGNSSQYIDQFMIFRKRVIS
jgi:ubiquinone/menaquinone biosynthesis C-methylase UbiE